MHNELKAYKLKLNSINVVYNSIILHNIEFHWKAKNHGLLDIGLL